MMWKAHNDPVWYYKNPGSYHYIIMHGPTARQGEKMITVYIKEMSWSDEQSIYRDAVMGLAGHRFPKKCNLFIELR
jgi:hypothetical protein